jgi:hypothetical protein
MVYSFVKTVAAAGTPEPLVPAALKDTVPYSRASWLIIQNNAAGNLIIGDSTVNLVGVIGLLLEPGQSVTLQAHGGAPAPYQLWQIYADVAAAGQKINVFVVIV